MSLGGLLPSGRDPTTIVDPGRTRGKDDDRRGTWTMELEHAIRDRLQVAFTYDAQPRIVVPATLGPHRMTGRLTLRGYQVGGRSNSRTPPFWILFSVDRISDLVITADRFDDDPRYCWAGDARIHPVIADLSAARHEQRPCTSP